MGKHFAEDPLRFFRGARFAAKLDFTLDLQGLTFKGEVSLGKQEEELRKVLLLQDPRKFFILAPQIQLPFFQSVSEKFLQGLTLFSELDLRILLFNFFYPESPILKNKKQLHLLEKIQGTDSLHSFSNSSQLTLLRKFLWEK